MDTPHITQFAIVIPLGWGLKVFAARVGAVMF